MKTHVRFFRKIDLIDLIFKNLFFKNKIKLIFIRLSSQGRSVVVFYGSQTGTAEEFASRLAKESMRFGLKAVIADPEECDLAELVQLKEIPNSLAIFCLAT